MAKRPRVDFNTVFRAALFDVAVAMSYYGKGIPPLWVEVGAVDFESTLGGPFRCCLEYNKKLRQLETLRREADATPVEEIYTRALRNRPSYL